MPSKLSSCVIGIDVGGTNTDAVILQNEAVLAVHKTPSTTDIQSGVERAIEEVVKKADIPSDHVDSVKIGTTVSLVFEFRLTSLTRITLRIRLVDALVSVASHAGQPPSES
jgi:predicted NBD/HSP70 family sugar kinase